MASSSSNSTPGKLVGTSRLAEIDKLLKEASLQPSRESFTKAVEAFLMRDKRRRGHLDFIDASLKWMEVAGLAKDLPTYNLLLDVFPRDRFRNRTLMDAIWPRPYPQIDAALRVLQKMEDNGIRPDYTTYSLMLEVFGHASLPVQKCRRIAYWFDRFENIDPYRLPQPIPNDPCELARLTLRRISGLDSEVKLVHDVGTSFVISSQAQWQREQLIGFAATSWEGSPLQVTGPHRTWLQHLEQSYFMLEASPNPPQYKEETVLALGMTSSRHSQDLLNIWVSGLEQENPSLVQVWGEHKHSSLGQGIHTQLPLSTQEYK
jgi:signaling intermediate in Toll pathway protein